GNARRREALKSAFELDGQTILPPVTLLACMDHACSERDLPSIAYGAFHGIALLQNLRAAVVLFRGPEQHADLGVAQRLEVHFAARRMLDHDGDGAEEAHSCST